MHVSFQPRLLRDAAVPVDDPTAVVETFLAALAAGDLELAGDLVDEHLTYVNVGLPPIKGRRRMVAALRRLVDRGMEFEVYLHAIAENAGTVLTERTDVLTFGRLRLQFWVAGRFDVRDGRITLWRDSFDYADLVGSVGRAIAGALVPSLRPKAPSSPDVQPGRH